jgi:hypothetical protein
MRALMNPASNAVSAWEVGIENVAGGLEAFPEGSRVTEGGR